MNTRIVKIFTGIFLGFAAQALSFILYWLWYTRNNSWSLKYFYKTIFEEMNVFQIGTLSILGAMVLFYFLNRSHRDFEARGVVISIIFGVMYLLSKMYT